MSARAKIVFVGNARTGKTTCAREIARGRPSQGAYVATLGVETHAANGGRWALWDCAGDPKFRGIMEGYYIHADVVVIFMDDERPGEGRLSADAWASAARTTAPSAEIVYVPAYAQAADVGRLITEALARRAVPVTASARTASVVVC